MSIPTFKFIASSLLFACGLLLCCIVSNGQTISGTVFRDYNSNGTYESTPASGTYAYGEPGVQGIEVRAYNTSGTQSGSALSESSGVYSFTPTGTGPYRIEFVRPGALAYLNDGFGATGGLTTSVRFTGVTSATLNFGVSSSVDYYQASPLLAVPCYISGDPLSATTSVGSEAALITVPYNSGTAVTGTYLATAGQVGTVFGSSYQRETKKLFTLAFLKRHAGLGSAGLGGIYVTDLSGALTTNSVYLDLESAPFSLPLGASLLAGRSLPGSGTVSSNDSLAFDAVGKVGLGGVGLSADGATMYIIDLFNRQLLALAIGNPVKATFSAIDLTKIAIPNPAYVNGVARPMAVKVSNGKVYIGVVCTGENGGSASDLFAHIYAMPEGTTSIPATPIFSFRLNYTKGMVHTQDAALGTGWETWTSLFSGINLGAVINPFSAGTVGDPFFRRSARPQPMLSDIGFADNGDMVLGFMDRGGHQLGYRQRNTTQVSSTTLLNGYIGGDLLRASYNGTNWVLENNGIAGSLTNMAGAGTGYADRHGLYRLIGRIFSTENFRGFLKNQNPDVEIH